MLFKSFKSFMVLLAVVLSSFANASSLAEMDRVLTKAPDLNAFLSNPQLIEEYYNVASEYYNDSSRFPRQSYDAIIDQMKNVAYHLPDFGKRAWETNLGKPFKVTSAAPTFGRNVNLGAWDKYLQTYKNQIHEAAGEFAQLTDDDARTKILSGLQSLKDRISNYEAQLKNSPMKKRERQELMGKFYQNLKQDKELQKLASYVLLRWLASDKVAEIFNSANADLILAGLKDFKDNPKKVLEQVSDIQGSEGLATYIKAALPDATELLKNRALFPVATMPGKDGKLIPVEPSAPGTWDFIPAPRRFHALFKGIYFGECVGGGCAFLTHLTPERWATAILKETQFHYLQKDGKFLGWVQAVPVTQNSNIFASVDFASFSFKQSVVSQKKDGTFYSESLFSAWLRQAMKNKPESWHGFVVGQSTAINNGGALPAVRLSPAYLYGEEYNPSSRPFAHYDPSTAHAISNIYPLSSLGQNYGGSMIFDGAVKDAGTLTSLAVTDKTLYQIINQAIQANDWASITQILSKLRVASMGSLVNEVLSLRGAGVLKLLSESPVRLYHVSHNFPSDPTYIIDSMLTLGLTVEELKYAQALICNIPVCALTFNQKLFESPLVTDADSAIKALSSDLIFSSTQYTEWMDQFMHLKLEHLVATYPNMTVDHLLTLEKQMYSTASAMVVVKVGLKVARNPADFFKLLDTVYPKGSGEYKKAISEAVGAGLPNFFAKNPTAKDLLRLANSYSDHWGVAEKLAFMQFLKKQPAIAKYPALFSRKIKDEKLSAYLFGMNVEAIVAAAKPEQKQLVTSEVKKHLHQLNKGTGWVQTLRAHFKLANTTVELADALTEFPFINELYIPWLRDINGENVARFLSLNPSFELLNKVFNNSYLGKEQALIIMKAMVTKSRTLAEFTEAFITPDKLKSLEAFDEAKENLLRASEAKLATFPELLIHADEVAKLKANVRNNSSRIDLVILAERIKKLEKVQKTTEWIELATKVGRISDERVNEFLGMNPNLEELTKVFAINNFSSSSELKLTKTIVKKSKTFAEFNQAFVIAKEVPQASLEAILIENEGKLRAFPELLSSTQEVMTLKARFVSKNNWLENLLLSELMKRTGNSRNSSQWVSWFQAQKQIEGGSYQLRVNTFARASYLTFMSLKPSPQEQSWYKDTFFKLHERIGLKFDEFRQPKPEVLTCEKLFGR